MTTTPSSRRDLSTLTLLGLIVGTACGLFFGEYCRPLSFVGDLFVGLLRMTVMPYICVTLVAGLGRLSMRQTGRCFAVGGITLVSLWLAALLIVWIMPFAFPEWKTGAFFSSAMVKHTPPTELFSQFVPANVFTALSKNQVPAVILFCICMGIALGKAEGRESLLVPLDVVGSVLMRISLAIARLAPIGIFAIAASTAGTVSLTEFVRMQTYLIPYTAAALLLGFVALPLLVTSTTRVTYRQFMRVVKEPLITAFATGKLIIVLPMLVENTERLLQEGTAERSSAPAPAAEALYATAYPFPHVGKLLSMLFIPFAAWFLGKPLGNEEYPGLLTSGLFAYFGGPILAVPFLLDQQQLPRDMFQLFLVSGVYGERLGDALGAIQLATLAIMTSLGFQRSLRFNVGSAAKYITVVLVTGAFTVGGVQWALYKTVGVIETRNDVITRIQLLEEPVRHSVVRTARPNPDPLLTNETLLQRIRRRGVLRVGFNEDKVPFAFFDLHGDLVGYDINMAHSLARDLDVELEFVRFDRATLAEQLRDDHFDVVMSGLVGTLERSEAMQHTSAYLDVNLALVVPDYRARAFKTVAAARDLGPLRIGFVDLSRGFVDRLRSALPNAELVEIRNNRDYFKGRLADLDALLISAESGSAFTLIYPNFEVVVPSDQNVKLPLFYAIGQRDQEMRDFLEHWIGLRQKDGTAQEYYEHWILGKTALPRKPRWSVIRDVLNWVE